MGIRFRKSIKLAPGIRMNLSGGGLSWTLGPRGASIGIGKRGTFLNTGIPGSGLYSRQSLNGGSSTPRQLSTSTTTTVALTVSVEDDGTITFKDSNGNPVSEYLIEQAKKQQGDVIKATIQKTCDDINAQVDALGELHLHTPPPNRPPAYQPQPFAIPRPVPSIPKVLGFFAKLFKSKVARVKAENEHAQANHEADVRDWDAIKKQHETSERQKQEFVSRAVAGNPEAMESFFEEVLMDITWPRETLVSFEVCDNGTRLSFDVNLPELEDMPTKTATAPQRGFRLSVKELGSTTLRKMYAKHIHSIGFRLLGEAFGMLPTVQEVTLSGYSQRKNKATGQEEDQYLYSVMVSRGDWERINFNGLESIDVLESFTRFNLRRDMTKTGLFEPIQTF